MRSKDGKAMKTIYLDTNMWIELERLQSDDDISRRQVLEHVLNQVERGLFRFPLSITHCLEMVKHGDADKRRSLWSFATRLSGCWAMLNKQCLLPSLIEEAVCKVFDVALERESTKVFTRSGLFGLDFKGQFPRTELLMNTEDEWNYFWLDMPDEIHDRLFEGLHRHEEAFIQRRNRLKNTFRQDSYALRKRAYVASLFLDMWDHCYMDSFSHLGKNMRDTETLTMEDRIRLVTEVPPLDVEVSLATQHLQQWDRPEARNDVRDIAHLCMAIPYCDVVVTERYWVDKIQREKLDKKYGTQVFSDLSSLL